MKGLGNTFLVPQISPSNILYGSSSSIRDAKVSQRGFLCKLPFGKEKSFASQIVVSEICGIGYAQEHIHNFIVGEGRISLVCLIFKFEEVLKVTLC